MTENIENTENKNTEIAENTPQAEAQALAEKLMSVMDNMEGFLSEETTLLQSGEFSTVAKQTEVKNNIVKQYEALLQEISSKKDVLKSMEDEKLKDKILARADDFSHIIRKNYYALQSASISAKRGTERITKAIQNKVQAEKQATYNAKGILNNGNAAAMTDGAY